MRVSRLCFDKPTQYPQDRIIQTSPRESGNTLAQHAGLIDSSSCVILSFTAFIRLNGLRS